jgi:hypothetical protein
VVLAAYLAVLLAILATIRQTRPRRHASAGPMTQFLVRSTSLALVGALSLGALELVVNLQMITSVGVILVLVFVQAAFTYAVGVALWRGQTAFALRLAGWTLMVLCLAVPSTLTLALPVVALLCLSLVRIPAAPSPRPA